MSKRSTVGCRGGSEMSEPMPTAFSMFGLQPGQEPGVRITYQCESLDDAMRLIRRAADVHTNVDAHYNRETGELVLVIK